MAAADAWCVYSERMDNCLGRQCQCDPRQTASKAKSSFRATALRLCLTATHPWTVRRLTTPNYGYFSTFHSLWLLLLFIFCAAKITDSNNIQFQFNWFYTKISSIYIRNGNGIVMRGNHFRTLIVYRFQSIHIWLLSAAARGNAAV